MSVRPLSPPLVFLLGELTMVAMLELVPHVVVAVVRRWCP